MEANSACAPQIRPSAIFFTDCTKMKTKPLGRSPTAQVHKPFNKKRENARINVILSYVRVIIMAVEKQ
jgi:hypothetical protein